MTRKPRKDEVITLEGEIKKITDSLITVGATNLAVLGGASKDMVAAKSLKEGETVIVTYQNGILLTIDRNLQSPQSHFTDKPNHDTDTKKVHINNTETSLECSGRDAKTAVANNLTSKQPEVNPEVCCDIPSSKHLAEETRNVHIELTTQTLAKQLEGKSYEEIFNLKELFDKIAKEANIKDTIDAFDKDRKDGAIVANAEMTGIGGVLDPKFDGTIYEHGARCDYKITIIIPESDNDKRERELHQETI